MNVRKNFVDVPRFTSEELIVVSIASGCFIDLANMLSCKINRLERQDRDFHAGKNHFRIRLDKRRLLKRDFNFPIFAIEFKL